MKFFVGDEGIDLTQEELDYRYLDEGKEAKIYEYGDEVLKLYKDYCPKMRLSEKDAFSLSQIGTEKVLLPKRIIHDEDGKFLGYTTKRIYGSSKLCIPKMKMKKLVDELDIIMTDLKILADNHYDVADFTLNNVVYDGGLYFVDPGSFMQVKNFDDRFKYSSNMATLNEFMLDDFFYLVLLSKKYRNKFDDNFDRADYIGDYIRCSMNENENVRQYVKRMSKVN